MDLVSNWLLGFIDRYRAVIAPQDWPTGQEPDALRYYLRAWVTALSCQTPKVTEAEADAALERLVLDPPRFRSEHIPAFVKAVHELRRETLAAAASPTAGPSEAEREARRRSRDCPECHGSGWAKRRWRWHSIPRPSLVDLFCRCPAGRWRKGNDPELLKGDHMRKHDDLQAVPAQWDPELWHPTWGDIPCDHDMIIDADCEGLWWYVPVGEPSPEPVAPASIAAGMFSTGGRS